jgi:hypothetical protein
LYRFLKIDDWMLWFCRFQQKEHPIPELQPPWEEGQQLRETEKKKRGF